MPAAGVEPAQSRMFIELVRNRVKIRVKKWKWHFLDNDYSTKKERSLCPAHIVKNVRAC